MTVLDDRKRVLYVGRQPLVRDGLAVTLARTPDLILCGDALPDSARDTVRRLRADAVVAEVLVAEDEARAAELAAEVAVVFLIASSEAGPLAAVRRTVPRYVAAVDDPQVLVAALRHALQPHDGV